MSENRGSVDYMWGGLDADFRARLQAFIAASGGGVTLLSGYRSNEHQADLVRQAQARHGADWRRWAAPPGASNHNRGFAGDLRFASDEWKNWAHQNAARFGLEFPMSHEPWHIEPLGLKNGKIEGADPWRDAYTFSDDVNPVDQQPDMMVEMDRLLRGKQPSHDDVGTFAGLDETGVAPPVAEMDSVGVDRLVEEGPDITEVADGSA